MTRLALALFVSLVLVSLGASGALQNVGTIESLVAEVEIATHCGLVTSPFIGTRSPDEWVFYLAKSTNGTSTACTGPVPLLAIPFHGRGSPTEGFKGYPYLICCDQSFETGPLTMMTAPPLQPFEATFRYCNLLCHSGTIRGFYVS